MADTQPPPCSPKPTRRGKEGGDGVGQNDAVCCLKETRRVAPFSPSGTSAYSRSEPGRRGAVTARALRTSDVTRAQLGYSVRICEV